MAFKLGMWYLIFLQTGLTLAAVELLQNAGFESRLVQNEWTCIKCDFERNRYHALMGDYCVKVRNRTEVYGGIYQVVPIVEGKNYYFSAYVKVLSEVEGFLYHRLEYMLDIDFVNGAKEYRRFGRLPYARKALGWTKLGADISTKDDAPIAKVRLYLQFLEKEVDFLLDSASLTEVGHDDQWRQNADASIDANRKNNIALSVTVAAEHVPTDIEIKVDQTRHDFGFGAAVQAWRIYKTDELHTKYQDYFYSNFEWAVIENAVKWRQMEKVRNVVDYFNADKAISMLSARGVPIRGHCVVWDVDRKLPDWTQLLSGEELEYEINRRFVDTMTHFRGDFVHWDINNEQTKGDFFERHTGNVDIMVEMFQNASLLDPDAKLFMNDYSIVSKGSFTQAYTNSINDMVAAGAPVDYVGIQSHLRGVPDLDLIRLRLDTVKSANLSIWITELDVEIEDKDARADGYEDVLRLYFSDPQVEGILLWGFWDKAHWRPKCALVEGDDFTPNAAGLRWTQLVKGEWETHESVSPTLSTEDFELRGFHGAYDVTVLHQGQVVKTETFYLNKGEDAVVQVNTAA